MEKSDKQLEISFSLLAVPLVEYYQALFALEESVLV